MQNPALFQGDEGALAPVMGEGTLVTRRTRSYPASRLLLKKPTGQQGLGLDLSAPFEV
jgi:hypothetical protein